MLKQVILHIGTPKTGSTALQLALSSQREKLICSHLYYPDRSILGEKLSPINLQDLTLYSAHQTRPLALRRFRAGLFNASEGRHAYDTKVKAGIKKVCEDAKAKGCSRLILSAEGLFSRLETREEIARLHDLLHGLCEQIHLLVWFRPQDDYLLSRVSQAAKVGTISVLDACRLDGNYLYFTRLELWRDVFTHSQITALPYRRDILPAFESAIGLPIGTLNTPSYAINARLSAAAVSLIARLETASGPERHGPAVSLSPGLRRLIVLSDQGYPSPALELDGAIRSQIMEKFDLENRRLSIAYNSGESFFAFEKNNVSNAHLNLPLPDSLFSRLGLPAVTEDIAVEWMRRIEATYERIRSTKSKAAK